MPGESAKKPREFILSETKDGVVGVRVFAARACSVYSATEKPSADDKDSSARAVSYGVPRIEHGALTNHKTQG